MTKNQLAKKIREIREEFELSQQELGDKVSLSRQAITQIEAGVREVSGLEIAKIAKLFELSVEELLSKEPMKVKCNLSKKSSPAFNESKFEQVLLYILEKCGAKPNVGETVIYKLLYFIETNFYELYEEYLTGESYRKIQHGPAPCHFNEVVGKMISENKVKKVVTEYYNQMQKKYIPTVKANLSLLNGKEIEVIENVIERLSSMNAAAIEDYSHNDVPYEITEDKQVINLETVFYRKPMHSVREYEDE